MIHFDNALSYASATMRDADLILRLGKDLIDRYEDFSDLDYQKVVRWMQAKIEKNISQYTKVCYCDEVVGYYSLSSNGTEAELDDFYILPPYRGQGLGNAVLRRCIQNINMPVFLYVFKENLGAIRFYSRFGFAWYQDVSKTRMILRRDG